MPIDSQVLGPGVLELGAGPLAVEQQLTGCKLVPAERITGGEDAVPVLSGDELEADPGTPTIDWTLQGEFLQTLLAAGVVAWSWANAKTQQPFTFQPNDSGASFTGTLVPVPLQVGGDEVKARMRSGFTWRVVGDPVPTWDV